MEYLVTGIAATKDPAEIEKMLAGAPLDQARLSTISKGSAKGTGHHDEHPRPFEGNYPILKGSEGTSVPGMGGMTSFSSLIGHGHTVDYLGGLPLIPPDQAEHFNIAISEGRTLVMYKATPEEAPQAETAFRNAGLRNVKIFKPKEPSLSS